MGIIQRSTGEQHSHILASFSFGGAGARHDIPSSNVGHAQRYLSVVSTLATSAQSDTIKNTAEYKSPSNTETLQSKLRQARKTRTSICTKGFRVCQAITTINLSNLVSRHGGIHKAPTTNAGPVQRLQLRCVMIGQDDIENMASINKITRVPRANEDDSTDIAGNTPRASNKDHSIFPGDKPDQEYAVEQIVDNAKTNKGIR